MRVLVDVEESIACGRTALAIPDVSSRRCLTVEIKIIGVLKSAQCELLGRERGQQGSQGTIQCLIRAT